MYPLCRIETRLVTYRIDTLSECCSPPRLAIFELARSSRTNIIEILAVNILRWSNPQAKVSIRWHFFRRLVENFCDLRDERNGQQNIEISFIPSFIDRYRRSTNSIEAREKVDERIEKQGEEKRRDDHWFYVTKVTKASWNNTVVIIRTIYYSSNILQ